MAELFHDGGWPMYPVLLFGLAAVVVAVIYAIEPRRSLLFTSLGLIINVVVMGIVGTTLGLIQVFAAVAGVDPSMKSALLARGISEAMSCTAFGFSTVPLWLVPFIVGVIRGRRSS